jgi:hypothetical protein
VVASLAQKTYWDTVVSKILEYYNDRRGGAINNWAFNIIKVIKQERCIKTTSVEMKCFQKAGGQGTTLGREM